MPIRKFAVLVKKRTSMMQANASPDVCTTPTLFVPRQESKYVFSRAYTHDEILNLLSVTRGRYDTTGSGRNTSANYGIGAITESCVRTE